MTDGVLIFEDTKSKYLDNGTGTTVTDLTSSSSKNNMLTLDPDTKWQSNGLNYSQGEHVKIVLSDETDLDTIILRDHNFKKYSLSYGVTNLLSDDFEDFTDTTYWSVQRATVATSTQKAPFSGKNMYLLTEDTTASNNHNISIPTAQRLSWSAGEQAYFHIYVKANGRDTFLLYFEEIGVNTALFEFDLDAETATPTLGDDTSATIEYIGDGIYRLGCSWKTQPFTTDLDVVFFLQDAGSTNYTGDGSSGAYIWGAEFLTYPSESFYSGRNFSNVTTINGGTASKINESNYSNNTSFYNFTSVDTDTIHLVVYEGQTPATVAENLIGHSDFSSSWTVAGLSSATANHAYNFEGKKEATYLKEDTNTGVHYYYYDNLEQVSVLPRTQYRFSVDAKKGGRDYVNLNTRLTTNSTANGANFNLRTGVVENIGANVDGANITDLGDEWYRCELIFTTGDEIYAAQDQIRIYIDDSADLTSRTYAGNGQSGIFVDRPQLARTTNPYVETTGTPVFSDRELYLTSFIVTKKIGQFASAGTALPAPTISQNARVRTNVNDKKVVQKGLRSFACTLTVNHSTVQADHNLIQSLKDYDDPVLLWLCGGYTGSTYFSLDIEPYRLQDIYRVADIGNSQARFYKNIRIVSARNSLNLVEVEN